jgi:transposase
MGASIGSGPEIGPPMGAHLAFGATSPARASWVIAFDHRRPFEAYLGNFVRARVERTLGWLGRWRRLSKSYEELPEVEEAMVKLAMIRLMLHRLAHPSRKRLQPP